MSDAVVELRNVTKKIGSKTIVDNLSFSVRRGEVYGFLGPNGAGKTTTIRMMVGLMSITAGDVIIEGHNVKTDRAKAMAHVGAIVENPELYKYMTGRQNLIHFARMSGTKVTQERIDEIVKLVELTQVLDKKVKNYSLGMRQRLGVAQALLHNPSILLLDEPSNGLDPAGIRELRDYLRRLAKVENISILVSSHMLSEVELMCDRVVVIQNGRFVGERVLDPNADVNQATGKAVQFRVAQLEDAERLLQERQCQYSTNQQAGSVTVTLQQEEIPELVSLMVQHGLKIYEVRQVAESLEDAFLSMTKGGQIV
ncbi:ABC transporter ATP-binding protein [Paenibacillus marinisediminis]